MPEEAGENVKVSKCTHFCDKCGRGKAEGEAHSRVQLTLFRPLGAIFEEVIGKLSGCRSCFKGIICIMQALNRQYY